LRRDRRSTGSELYNAPPPSRLADKSHSPLAPENVYKP
jgi:hypothetical protein